MAVQFFLYIVCVLLILIFWELSKINGHLRKALNSSSAAPLDRALKERVAPERG